MGLWGGIKSTLGKIGETEGMSFQDRISVVRAMQSDDPMAAYRVRKDIRNSMREDQERFRDGGAEGMGPDSIDPATGQLKTQTSGGWQNGDYSGLPDRFKGPQRLRSGEQALPAGGGGYPGFYGGPQADPLRIRGFDDGARPGPYDIPGLGAGLAGKLQAFSGRPGEPTLGTVENGYRFNGGNPADPDAWDPARGAGFSDRYPFRGSYGR